MNNKTINESSEDDYVSPLCIDEVIDVLIHIYPSPVFLFINKQYNKVCKTMLNKYMNILPRRRNDMEQFRTTYNEIMNGNLLVFSNVNHIRSVISYFDEKYYFGICDKMTYMIAEDYYVDSFSEYIKIEGGDSNICKYIKEKTPLWRIYRQSERGDSSTLIKAIYAKNLEAIQYFKPKTIEFYGERFNDVCLELLAVAVYTNWVDGVKEFIQPSYEQAYVTCNITKDGTDIKHHVNDPQVQELIKDIFCGQCKQLSIMHFIDSNIEIIDVECKKCKNMMKSYPGGKHICYDCSICTECYHYDAQNIKNNKCDKCIKYNKCDSRYKLCDTSNNYEIYNDKYCNDCKSVNCTKCDKQFPRTTYLGDYFKCSRCNSMRY